MHPASTPSEIPGFGVRLHAWREGNQFDLDAAARLLGVSANYVYMIERGVHAPSRPLVARFEQLVRDLSVFVEPEVMRRIPILSWVQAGRARGFEQMPDGWMDWVDCLCPDPNAFAVRVVGESMLPKYLPGNLVICMPSFPPKNHSLAVAKLRDESVTFKKLTFRGALPSCFHLVPINPSFTSVRVKRADLLWIYPVHSVVGRSNS